jgi:AcrR family transcriptional regulator
MMRKQREIWQREQMFLDVARGTLIESVFAGLSLDRLAEAPEDSRGTVYQHFSTKEDLVTALAVQSNEQRLALFDRARALTRRPARGSPLAAA